MDSLLDDNTPIEQLGLGIRAYNALHRAKLLTVGQIRSCSDADLLQIRNFGKKSLNEIRQKLQLPITSVPLSRWSLEQQHRQSQAYNLLITIEEQIRRFICHTLIEAYGQDWLMNGIPQSTQRLVNQRLGIAQHPLSPSDYLRHIDFGEYKKIILEPNNWQVFSSKLDNDAVMKKHLDTINVHRRSIAHSRCLSEEELKSLELEAVYVAHSFRIRKASNKNEKKTQAQVNT